MIVAAVVLAAGQSRRMGGENKLLAPLGGAPLVRRAVAAARASRARPVVVVTGHEADRVEAALAGLGVRTIRNPDYALGLSASLRVGLAALEKDGVSGALICLGDMPRVTAATLDRLIDAFEAGGGRAVCAPTADGRRGNPVLWPADLFAAMKELAGDAGARELIARHADRLRTVPADAAEIFNDVDTPEALAAARAGEDRL